MAKPVATKMKTVGGNSDFYKMKDLTKEVIRLLPLKTGENIARLVGEVFLNGKPFIDPQSTHEKPSPIMEAYNRLSKSSKEKDKELASKIKPRIRYWVKALVRSTGKVVIIPLPSGCYKPIYEAFQVDETDLSDPQTGCDIRISAEGAGFDREYSARVLGQSPLSKSAKEIKKWTDEANAIDFEGLLAYDLKEIKKELARIVPDAAGAADDEDDEETDDEDSEDDADEGDDDADADEDDEEEKPAKKSKKPAKDEDDEEEEEDDEETEEDDEEETDDEEEEEVKPSKKGKKPVVEEDDEEEEETEDEEEETEEDDEEEEDEEPAPKKKGKKVVEEDEEEEEDDEEAEEEEEEAPKKKSKKPAVEEEDDEEEETDDEDEEEEKPVKKGKKPAVEEDDEEEEEEKPKAKKPIVLIRRKK